MTDFQLPHMSMRYGQVQPPWAISRYPIPSHDLVEGVNMLRLINPDTARFDLRADAVTVFLRHQSPAALAVIAMIDEDETEAAALLGSANLSVERTIKIAIRSRIGELIEWAAHQYGVEAVCRTATKGHEYAMLVALHRFGDFSLDGFSTHMEGKPCGIQPLDALLLATGDRLSAGIAAATYQAHPSLLRALNAELNDSHVRSMLNNGFPVWYMLALMGSGVLSDDQIVIIATHYAGKHGKGVHYADLLALAMLDVPGTVDQLVEHSRENARGHDTGVWKIHAGSTNFVVRLPDDDVSDWDIVEQADMVRAVAVAKVLAMDTGGRVYFTRGGEVCEVADLQQTIEWMDGARLVDEIEKDSDHLIYINHPRAEPLTIDDVGPIFAGFNSVALVDIGEQVGDGIMSEDGRVNHFLWKQGTYQLEQTLVDFIGGWS